MVQRLLLFCGIAMFLSACSNDYRIDRRERRLIGAWEFEKAFYKPDNALFRDNITDQYRNDVVEFFGDYQAVYHDFSLRASFAGDWRIILDRDFYGEDNNVEFFVDAAFFDSVNGEEFFLFGSIDRLNQNKLHLESSDRFGCYTFRLRRL